MGVLGIIFGVILLLNYWKLAAIVALFWFAAIMALAGGVLMIIQAFQQRTK